ncbi:MAG: Hpt domain-containing protein [Candidatus Levyibacteriota bacterium]
MPLSQDDHTKYKALYLQTAREYIKELQDNTSVLIVTPENISALESVHRAAHSLATQSTIMEYNQIGAVSAVMEKLFKQSMVGKTLFTREILQSLLDTAQTMSQDLEAIDKDNKENDLSQDATKLQTLVLT